MGKNTFNKLAQVGARVRPWVRQIIKERGYTISDAVTYFAELLKRDNPVEVLKIQIFCKQKELDEVLCKKRELVHCEEDIREDLASLQDELSQYGVEAYDPEVLDHTPEVEIVEDDFSDDMKIAIQRVQKVFDEKKDLLFSPGDSKEDMINVLISLNGDMFFNLHKEFGKGLSWVQFKEDIVRGVEA